MSEVNPEGKVSPQVYISEESSTEDVRISPLPSLSSGGLSIESPTRQSASESGRNSVDDDQSGRSLEKFGVFTTVYRNSLKPYDLEPTHERFTRLSVVYDYLKKHSHAEEEEEEEEDKEGEEDDGSREEDQDFDSTYHQEASSIEDESEHELHRLERRREGSDPLKVRLADAGRKLTLLKKMDKEMAAIVVLIILLLFAFLNLIDLAIQMDQVEPLVSNRLGAFRDSLDQVKEIFPRQKSDLWLSLEKLHAMILENRTYPEPVSLLILGTHGEDNVWTITCIIQHLLAAIQSSNFLSRGVFVTFQHQTDMKTYYVGATLQDIIDTTFRRDEDILNVLVFCGIEHINVKLLDGFGKYFKRIQEKNVLIFVFGNSDKDDNLILWEFLRRYGDMIDIMTSAVAEDHKTLNIFCQESKELRD